MPQFLSPLLFLPLVISLPTYAEPPATCVVKFDIMEPSYSFSTQGEHGIENIVIKTEELEQGIYDDNYFGTKCPAETAPDCAMIYKEYDDEPTSAQIRAFQEGEDKPYSHCTTCMIGEGLFEYLENLHTELERVGLCRRPNLM